MMSRSIGLPCFLLLFSILRLELSWSQCAIPDAITIFDLPNNRPDTLNVSLIVDNAVNNDLASLSQGVCGVQLRFTHPFMKELSIELVSPSGQVVRLTGGNIVTTSTPFITWDVTFVPCSAAPNPDPGFNSTWENDQLWLSFTNYNGQYHPHDGCLEDFNAGSVNGTWTFRCIDFEDRGVGRLLDASIIFCEEDGVSCFACQLDPGNFNQDTIESCEGDTLLNISFDKIYNSHPPDSSLYAYSNIIFFENTLLSYDDFPRPSSWESGEYSVCGIQFALIDSLNIPPEGSQLTKDSLQNYFFTNGICAEISSECIHFKINATAEPSYLDTTICTGTFLVLGGDSLSLPGVYEVLIPNGVCDSLVVVTLTNQDFDTEIQSDKTTISCFDSLLIITGLYLGDTADNITYEWSTNDGFIVSDSDESELLISQEGQYTLWMSGNFDGLICYDTTHIIIGKDETFPDITFQVDTLNCIQNSVDVNIISSQPLIQEEWTAKNGSNFLLNPSGIRTQSSDVYIVTVRGLNDCVVIDSVFVPIDTIFFDPNFSADTLNCILDSVQIITTTQSNRNYTFLWSNVGMEYSNSVSPYVFTAGTFLTTITDSKNGCFREYAVDVFANNKPPQIFNIFIDTLTCDLPVVIPSFEVDSPISEFYWQGPGFVSTESNPEIINEGVYQLTLVSSQNGCDTTIFLEVVADNSPPDIDIIVDTLNCLKDTLNVTLLSNRAIRSINWIGPNGFLSNDQNPQIYDEGLYTVEVIAENGCITIDTVEIIKSVNRPFVELLADSLTCAVDSLQIEILEPYGDYTFLWSGNGLVNNDSAEPYVTQPGLYEVTVTDNGNGCTDKFEIFISDYRIFSDVELDIPVLTCFEDSVQVVLRNRDTKSMIYFKEGTRIEDISPFLTMIGTYFYEFTNIYDCLTSGSFELIRDDSLPQIFLDYGKIQCAQDSILVEVSSDIRINSFEWLSATGIKKLGSQVYWFEGGSYRVTAIGENGCTSTENFEIEYDTIAPQFTINPISALTCRDSVVVLTISTTDEYESLFWQPSNIFMDSLEVDSAGLYVATMKSDNNCETEQSVIVIENKDSPTFQSEATLINCDNQVSLLSVIPTSSFSEIRWDNDRNPIVIPINETSFSTSILGTYFFEIENDLGCVSSGQIEVLADLTKPNISGHPSENITCDNLCSALKVMSTDSLIRYVWNGPGLFNFVGNDSICVDSAGTYLLEVTGANYCTETIEFVVVKDNRIPQFQVLTDTLNCNKDTVSIGVFGEDDNLIFNWSGPDTFDTNSGRQLVTIPGVYTIVGTAPNGCSSTKEVAVVGDFARPQLEMDEEIILPCDSSLIQIGVESDLPLTNIIWIFPNGDVETTATISTDLTGDFIVLGSGVNGCLSDSVFFTIVPDKGDLGLSVDFDTLTCSQPMVSLTISSQRPLVVFTTITPEGTILVGDKIQVELSGPYIIEGIDSNGCIDVVEVFIPIDTLHPEILVDSSGQIMCENRSVILDASSSIEVGDLIGMWSTANGFIENRLDEWIIEVSEPGVYTLFVTNIKNGCSKTKEFWVEELPSNLNSLGSIITPPFCEQWPFGSIALNDINGSPPFNIHLNGKDEKEKIVFTQLKPGPYNFLVKDSNGCIFEETVIIPDVPDYQIMIKSSFLISLGDSLTLVPEFNEVIPPNSTLSWFLNDSLICENCLELTVFPTQNSLYKVVFSIDGFCEVFAEILIQVNRKMDTAIPNVFNPSSNQGNDKFYIPQTRGIESIEFVYIFDRWAENVFRAQNVRPGDATWGWDGTFKGKECQPGVYIVIAELTLIDGTLFKYQGDVTLIR